MGFETRTANPRLAAAIEVLADEACTCEDLECAAEVQAKLMELVRDTEEPSESDQQKIMNSIERIGAAYAKLAILHRSEQAEKHGPSGLPVIDPDALDVAPDDARVVPGNHPRSAERARTEES